MIFFVSGGSRGIGSAIVLAAAAAGHDVSFTYANDEQAAHEVLGKARSLRPDGKFRTDRLDVRQSCEVETVCDRVLEDFEKVDVVIANAGINKNNLAVSMSDEEWNDVIDTNLSGAFFVCRYFLPTFLAHRFGRFIFISSLGANGVSGQANYAASKAGLLGLSATLAKEYGRKGITSNVISPGAFETDMTQDGMPAASREFWMRFCPAGRFGELSEVADMVLFLASPAAAFINGQDIGINGGLEWAP